MQLSSYLLLDETFMSDFTFVSFHYLVAHDYIIYLYYTNLEKQEIIYYHSNLLK